MTATGRPGEMTVTPYRRTCRLGVTVFAGALACSSGESARDTDTPQAAGGQPRTPPPAATPAGPLTESSITPQMVAVGDSIYHGQAAGGICFTCHGPGAKGTPTAPDLTDQQWINGDGTLDFIANTVRNGVPQPKQFPVPMPAFGQSFTEEQIRAVAAYVYALSHPNVGAAGS